MGVATDAETEVAVATVRAVVEAAGRVAVPKAEVLRTASQQHR